MVSCHDDLRALVRTVPDFPRPGVQFRDVTPLLLDAHAFASAIDRLAERLPERPDFIAAVEARGFVIGAALAHRVGAGLILIRKDGKLPGETIAEDYALEYGTGRLVMHVDSCVPGARVQLADDLIATGGSARATVRLVSRNGGCVIGASFLVDLPDLGGSQTLRAQGIPADALITFHGA